jgi:hypothetical protein
MEKTTLQPGVIGNLLKTIIILVFSVILSFLFIKYGYIIFLAVAGGILAVIVLIYESKKRLPNNKPLLLIPILIISIPLQNIFLTTYPMRIICQFSVYLIIAYYLFVLPDNARQEFWGKIKLLILPTMAFLFAMVLAYIASGELQKADWAFILCLPGSIGYAYLAGLYCNKYKDIKNIIWFFVGIGVLQLPFMYAQSHGWTDWLPGSFYMYTSSAWGGPLSDYSYGTLRFGGMFGDYELIAEYLDMMIFFCLGIALFANSWKERFFALLSMCIVLAAGFYTGTRTFLWGIAVGLAIMIFLLYFISGFRNIFMRLITIGFFLLLGLAFLSSLSVFSGYIERFGGTDFSSGYFDTRNTVWNVSLYMMQNLPFTGYGAQMMNVFDIISQGVFESPHSLYFSMILIAGIPGVCAIIIMICTPIFLMLRLLFNKNVIMYRDWAIIFICVWGFWIINEIKIEFIRIPAYTNVIFFLLGIAASYYYIALNESGNVEKKNYS